MSNLQLKKANALKNKKGFTLIELIVVIVILGILAAILIPRLSGFSDTAKKSADISSAKTLATAAAALYAKNGTTGDVTSNADFKAMLPDGISMKTQLKDSAYVVNISTSGDVTVKDALGNDLYPTQSGLYGTGATASASST